MSAISSSKFIQLLKTFDEAEIKGLCRWLKSPWCNSNKNLVKLLKVVTKYHPDYESNKLTKAAIFKSILPNGKYSDRRLNNLMSEAYLAARKFLVFERFASNNHQQDELWIAELQDRNLDEWFRKRTQKSIATLEALPIKRYEDHLALFRTHRQLYHHPTASTRMQPGNRNIIKMGKQLDLLYLLEKAAIITEKRMRNRIIRNENHEVKKESIWWIDAAKSIEHPSLNLYRMRLSDHTQITYERYWQIRKTFYDQFELLNEREQKIHLLYILNDTKAFIKQGLLDITDTLPIYKTGLDKGFLLHQGKLSQNTFTTIVVSSNTKGDFPYSQHFIQHYTKYLDDNIQADCKNWAYAHTAYWQKDLEKCLNLLRDHEFKSPYFQLITRMLNTQAYFELYLQDKQYEDYLFSYFDTYEKWLQRDKIYAQSSKKSFLRFVQLCRALAKCYRAIDFSPKQVKQLLEEEKNVQALNWLRQQQEAVLRSRNGVV